MMFKTHIAFGFLAGIWYITYFGVSNQLLFMAIILFGALLPDIDHPKSKIGSKFQIVGFLFEHRGFFHGFLVIPLISLLVYYFTHSLTYVLPLCTGYVSHLISDAATKEGIMPFHPISKYRVRGFIKTGGVFEYVLFIALIIFAAYKTINL